jgi:hypothetical protein
MVNAVAINLVTSSYLNPVQTWAVLITVARGVVLWTDDQTTALFGTAVDGFDNVDELLLVFKDPVQLVVVACSEITHYVLVAEEEHDGARVVELIHLVEVGDLVNVADVHDREALDLVSDLVEHLVLLHAGGVPVAAEADDDEALLLAEDGLVDMPAGVKVGDDDGTHVLAAGGRGEGFWLGYSYD